MASMNLSFDTVPMGTNINDVKVDPRLRVRISTGIPFFDYILSGDAPAGKQGLLPGGVYLFTGEAGSGKSTLSLQLLDGLQSAGHTALFNGVEESCAQTKMTTERLGLTNGFGIANAVFMDAPTAPKDLVDRVGDNFLRAHMEYFLARHTKTHGEFTGAKGRDRCMAIVVDSLQAMNDGKWGLASNNKTPIRVLEELTQFAKAHFVPIIVIGHVGKNGEFKGDNTLKHMVDGHIHMYVDHDDKSPTEGCRILEMQKNRFGPTGISVVLDIGGKGLVERGARQIRGQKV